MALPGILLAFFLLAACIIAVALVRRLTGCPKGVWRLFVVALLARVVALVIVHYLPPDYFNSDQGRYERNGAQIADEWRGQLGPYPMAVDGYDYINAAVFYVVGPEPLFMQFVNMAWSTLLVVGVFALAWVIWRSPLAAGAAGWLTALTPSFVVWATDNDKENIVGLLLMSAIAAGLVMQRRSVALPWRVAAFLGIVAIGVGLDTFGPDYKIYLGGCALIYPLLTVPWRWSWKRAVAFATVILVLGIAMPGAPLMRVQRLTMPDIKIINQIRRGRATGNLKIQVHPYHSWRDVLVYLPKGMVWFVLRPYPWEMTTVKQIITIPEIVVGYAAIVAAVIAALRLWPTRRRLVITILVPVVLIVVARAFIETNVGSGFNHRFPVTWMLYALGSGALLTARRPVTAAEDAGPAEATPPAAKSRKWAVA